MQQLNLTMTTLYVWLTTPRPRDERGDIPGWVLVTVMTAGIVVVIWGIAREAFEGLINDAIAKIKGEAGKN